MNAEQQIKTSLIGFATIVGRDLNEFALAAFYDAISDLPSEQVLHVLKNWFKTNRNFPHPADIRASIMPEMNNEDNALEVANAIIAAISRYGYTNPKSAQLHIGSLGWEVVNRMGGWKHMCETCTHGNENTLRSQIRTFAETVSKRAKRGELDQRPELPQSNAVKNIVNGTFKSIEHVEGETE